MIKKLFNKKLISGILCFAMLATSFSLLSSENVYNEKKVYAKSNAEFRSAWVSTVWNLDFKNTNGVSSTFKSEYNKVLDSFSNMNMNAVTFQVRPVNDAFYPSKLNPWSKYLTGVQGKSPEKGFDPLAYMVSETHKKGMEYHAWFNPFRVTESKQVGKTKDQILSTLSANNFARKNPNLVMLYGGKLYFNPGEPKAQQFIIDTVMEVVKNYNIDAVHFDDYFYPYDASFKKDNPDMETFKKYKGNFKSIEDWRRNNIDTLIKNIHTQIKKVKPNVKFGISPFGIWSSKAKNPEGTDGISSTALTSYHSSFADTRKWVKMGWIDYITPQLYWSMNNNVASYTKLVDWWANTVKGTNCALYIGHAVYKYNNGEAGSYEANDWKNPSQIPMQIEYARNNPNVSGSCFFSLRNLTSNLAGFKSTLVSKYYTSKVPTSGSKTTPIKPNYPVDVLKVYNSKAENRLVWIDSKNSGAVKYKVYRFTGKEIIDNNYLLSTITRKGQNTYNVYTDTKIKISNKYTYIIHSIDSSGKVLKEFRKN